MQELKMEQKQPFQQMVLGDLDSYVQKNESQSPTYTILKNKFKVDKRLKCKSWHHKSPKGNIGRKISDIPCSNIFTDTSPKARDIKERINKWDLIKIKSFCMAKENSIKMKREPTIWENIFANDTSDKGVISKIVFWRWDFSNLFLFFVLSFTHLSPWLSH